MSALTIDIKNFSVIAGRGRGTFLHKVQKGRLLGDSRIFYKKEMENLSLACLEGLAQEFFRLIVPDQPETKIAWNPQLNIYYILSEEVLGYKNLPTDSAQNFTQGNYFGLGQVLLLSVFLQEIDLKNGNICLNQNNQVIKIDGDWCFAAIRHAKFKEYKKNITPNLLLTLPFPFGYSAFHWLDIYNKGVASLNSAIVDDDLANKPHFRQEINEAILKILVLTDDYISRFVDAYVSVGIKADVFISYLKNRRQELKLTALQDQSFKAYLVSPLAKELLKKHLVHMKNFLANGHYSIIEKKDHFSFENEATSIYEHLCASLTPSSHQLVIFEQLNAIDIDFSSKTTKNDIIHHRDELLKKIKIFIESLSDRADNNQSDRNKFIKLAQEKKLLIQKLSSQLAERAEILQQLSFERYLMIFNKKQQEMLLKSPNNANYSLAEKKTKLFCLALKQAENNFLSLDQPLDEAKRTLKKECLEAIKEVRPILDRHREWKGVIKKFIIDILSFLSLGLTQQLGLFAKTDSAVKLDNLEQSLDDYYVNNRSR